MKIYLLSLLVIFTLIINNSFGLTNIIWRVNPPYEGNNFNARYNKNTFAINKNNNIPKKIMLLFDNAIIYYLIF